MRGNAILRAAEDVRAQPATHAVNAERFGDVVLFEEIIDAGAARILAAIEDEGAIPFLADLAVVDARGADGTDVVGMVIVEHERVARVTGPPQQRFIDDVRSGHVPMWPRFGGVANLHDHGAVFSFPIQARRRRFSFRHLVDAVCAGRVSGGHRELIICHRRGNGRYTQHQGNNDGERQNA